MKIVISDANILIDLIRLDMIEAFFQFEHLELKTTDFIFDELLEEQQAILQVFIDKGNLAIIEAETEAMSNISTIFNKTNGLSIQDCSAWYFAKATNGILLTGDGKLRKLSAADGVEVRGILFIFDQLLLAGHITFETAVVKIHQLYQINDRLPSSAKYQRLGCWGRTEHLT